MYGLAGVNHFVMLRRVVNTTVVHDAEEGTIGRLCRSLSAGCADDTTAFTVKTYFNIFFRTISLMKRYLYTRFLFGGGDNMMYRERRSSKRGNAAFRTACTGPFLMKKQMSGIVTKNMLLLLLLLYASCT